MAAATRRGALALLLAAPACAMLEVPAEQGAAEACGGAEELPQGQIAIADRCVADCATAD